MAQMMTLDRIRKDPGLRLLIDAANQHLAVQGYTDHGPRHAGFVSHFAKEILRCLSFDERIVELAAIAGYVHDIGNSINRNNHGVSGACMLFPLLLQMDMVLTDVLTVVTAVGNHEEDYGVVTGPVTAAVVIADKADASRSRVRNGTPEPGDIHDRVNFAIQHNRLTVDPERRVIRDELDMNTSSSVMEYLTIYMSRIAMCEKAARFLGCTFDLIINGHSINATI
ncbi:phosphohydrolase [Clostridia bacterium]|nr:phosphohydrolase [Clostridia bacterium]